MDHHSNGRFSAPADEVWEPVVLENWFGSDDFALGLGCSEPDGAIQNTRRAANTNLGTVSILYRGVSWRKSGDPAKPVYEYGSLLPCGIDYFSVISGTMAAVDQGADSFCVGIYV